MSNNRQTVFVICGPTAVGKSAFAIKLAQVLNTSIISADSRQCYTELNIGVAKPSASELSLVQHYFIGSHTIKQEVNAGVFEQYALQAANKIFKQNDTAVMVGGTGLYIKAFCEGIDEIPVTPSEIRNQLTQNYQRFGLDWLKSEVQKKDLAFWKVAEQQNPHRLLRALEVLEASGKSITAYKTGNEKHRSFNVIKIGLQLPRAEINQRINQRVDDMVRAGLVQEVESLLPYQQLNALQTVGYTELFNYLNGTLTLNEAIERIKINTRHYAKRQMTWFKKDEAIKWYSADTVSVENVLSFYKLVSK